MKKQKQGCVICKNYNTKVITFNCLSCNNGSNFKKISEFKNRSQYRRFVEGR